MFGSPYTVRRKPCVLAMASSAVPGSVMAMKCAPALRSPTALQTSAKKYCLKALVSTVPPDLDETMNSVLAGEKRRHRISRVRLEEIEGHPIGNVVRHLTGIVARGARGPRWREASDPEALNSSCRMTGST